MKKPKKKISKKNSPTWPYWIEFRYPNDGKNGLEIYIIDATVPRNIIFYGAISLGSLEELQRMAMNGKAVYYSLLTTAQAKRAQKTGKTPVNFPK